MLNKLTTETVYIISEMYFKGWLFLSPNHSLPRYIESRHTSPDYLNVRCIQVSSKSSSEFLKEWQARSTTASRESEV